MSQPAVMYPEKQRGNNRSLTKSKSAAAVAAAAILKTNLGFKVAKHPEAVSVRPASYIHIKPDTSLAQKPKVERNGSQKRALSESEASSESDDEYFSTNETKDESEEASDSEDDGERVKFGDDSSEEEAEDDDNEGEEEEEAEQHNNESYEPRYTVLGINESPNDKGSRPNSRISKSWSNGARSPRGLLNTGVTCYMNSAIQSLIHVPPFSNFLVSVHKGNQPEISKQSVTKDLAQLQHKMLDPSVTRNIYPAAIIRRLDDINPMMSVWQQEDSHEYFMSLLSRVQEDTVPAGKKLRTSILHEIFGGTYEQKVTCQECKTVSTTHQDFYDLPVSFSAKERKQHGKFTLQTSIKEFFSPAVIKAEKNNSGGYECEKCKKHTTAITVSKIEEPSEYLPINIKRFNFKEKSSRKIKDPMNYPLELDLTEFSVDSKVPLKYKLTSVTMHEGRTTSSGHYVVFCNQPNNTWALYDDESVRKVTEKAVLRHQEDAYFLIYTRLTPVEIKENGTEKEKTTSTPKKKTHAVGVSQSSGSSSLKTDASPLKTKTKSPKPVKKLRRSKSMPNIAREASPDDEKNDAGSAVSTPIKTPVKKVKKVKHGLNHSKSLSNMKRGSSLSTKLNGSLIKSPHSSLARLTEKLEKRRQDKKRARDQQSTKNGALGGVEQGLKKRKLDSEIDKIFGNK